MENAGLFCAIALAKIWVAPGIVHDDDPTRLNAGLCLFKTDRTDLRPFLAAINDPKHEEHDSMLTWIGGAFDPEGFDLNAINRMLRFGRP